MLNRIDNNLDKRRGRLRRMLARDRVKLEQLIRRAMPRETDPKVHQAITGILDGHAPARVARDLGVHPATVSRWWQHVQQVTRARVEREMSGAVGQGGSGAGEGMKASRHPDDSGA